MKDADRRKGGKTMFKEESGTDLPQNLGQMKD